MCTCVCRIQEESPAHLSGLQTGNCPWVVPAWEARCSPLPAAAPVGQARACTGAHCGLCVSLAGDILSSINGVSIEGFGHKQIVDLIKSSGNYLRWVSLLWVGFGLISSPTAGRTILPHSPAAPEGQKPGGLGWAEPLLQGQHHPFPQVRDRQRGLAPEENAAGDQTAGSQGTVVNSTAKWRWLLGFAADGAGGFPRDTASWQGLTPVGSLLPAPPALLPLASFFVNQE